MATTANFIHLIFTLPIKGSASGDTLTLTVPLDNTTVEFASSVLRVKDLGVTEGKLGLSDVTTANASTSKHGLLRKLDGNSAHVLLGDGTWGTAPGTPSSDTAVWLPLTTVVGGVPDLVWSGPSDADALVATLIPI